VLNVCNLGFDWPCRTIQGSTLLRDGALPVRKMIWANREMA
jgi:hypothetical protein